MLWRSMDAGLSVAWVTGDTVYGSAQSLRAGLEARSQAYALAVTSKEHVEVQGTRRRVDRNARSLTRQEWQELSAGSGSKGPRLFAWARIELAAPEISGWKRWLLIRKSRDEGTKPVEVATWHGRACPQGPAGATRSAPALDQDQPGGLVFSP